MGEGIFIFVLWYLGIAYNYYVGELASGSSESSLQSADSGKAQDKKSQDEQDSNRFNPLIKIEVDVPPMDQYSVALEAEAAEPPAEPAPEPEPEPEPEPAADDE